jgi:hypothetical protein
MTTSYPTTTVERLLLVATLVLLPLEDHIPTVAGFSLLFLLFALSAAYVAVHRGRALYRVVLHPAFVTAYAFLLVSFLMEFSYPNADYEDLSRIGFMLAGAVIIAALCRDEQAMRGGIYASIAAGVWLSVLLFTTSYGALQSATAISYQEASQTRAQILKDVPLELNANKMALYTALGTAAALSLTLTARSFHKRMLFLGITLFSLVATFLPMSRSGILVVIAACGVVTLTYRAKRAQAMALAVVLGIGIMSLVPGVVFSRMEVSTGARAQVYAAAIRNVPEYWATGVGVSNYWGEWGFEHGFGVTRNGISGVMGTHNIFFQTTIYWGGLSLLALFTVIWQGYHCLPQRSVSDSMALFLKGNAVAVLVSMFFVHTLYDKHFSIALGLLVSASCWLWPAGMAQAVKLRQRSFSLPMFSASRTRDFSPVPPVRRGGR